LQTCYYIEWYRHIDCETKTILKNLLYTASSLEIGINNEGKSSAGYLSTLHSEIQIQRKNLLFETPA